MKIFLLVALAALVAAYPTPILPKTMVTQFGVAENHMGFHFFARGNDSQLYYAWGNTTDFSEWNAIPTPMKMDFVADPAVGVNSDGRLEVFIRYNDNLDIWQTYQTDANKPMSWAKMRECACLDIESPVCKNVTTLDPRYWNQAPVFPSSNVNVYNRPDGRLRMVYRGFEGHMYFTEQVKPGDSKKYTNPAFINFLAE